MTTKLLGKKVGGKRLGFMALAFSTLFCASSLQVYRGERVESEARKSILVTLSSCQTALSAAGEYQILHLATHGTFSPEDRDNRAYRLIKGYDHTLSVIAHEFAHIVKDDKNSTITLTYAQADALVIEAHLRNSLDGYFYDRLLLEKRRQEEHLSQSSYEAELIQMSRAYADKLPISEVTSDEESLREKLDAAEQQLSLMQTQVKFLKEQLAQAERSTSEKWFPVITAILSLLIALSANVIAWRTDRRQAREAELLTLKRQDLEKNIIQKDQQIRESSGRIIAPSPQEVQLYSRAVLVDGVEWGNRSGAQHKRRQKAT